MGSILIVSGIFIWLGVEWHKERTGHEDYKEDE